jgi:UDP-N-acetyl-D-galactosamine dehydrogenase
VPTPIDDNKNPNLQPLLDATKLISSILNKGDIIVYESTVYPGVVEDECGKFISDLTGFELNKDFYLG